MAEKLKKLGEQIYGQAVNGYQRRKLRPILDAHIAVAADGIKRHVGNQQAAYERGVAAAAIQTSKDDAIVDPANLPNAVYRAEGAARDYNKGQPPEAVETAARAAGSSVIAAVIGDRLAHDDPMGVTLLQQHADRLDPADRRTLGAAAEMLSNSLAAAAWVRDRSARPVAPAPTGDAALDAVNEATASAAAPPPVVSSAGRLLDQDGVAGIGQRLAGIDDRRRTLTTLNAREFAGNPVRRRANQAAIDSDTARNRAAVKAEADGLYASLRRHLTTGGPGGGPAVTLPPATLMSRLGEGLQAAVTAQVDRTIEGRATRTDPQTWYAIHQGLTGNDADERERWASTNLVQFTGRLSDEDFAALEKLQAAVRTNDGSAEQTRLQAITRMANQALRSAGIDPTPRPDAPPGSDAAQAAMYYRALQDDLSAVESRGRPPTAAEAYGIVNGLKDTGIKSGWLKVSDRSATVDSDIPSTDNAFHRPGVQVAQAGPNEDKPDDAARAPATEPDPSSAAYRDADRQARGIVAEQEIQQVENDRAISRWMMTIRSGQPVPELPKEIAASLGPEQLEDIQDIIDAGAAIKSDSETFENIFLGLTSKDRGERLKWAREALYRYRPQLSERDFANLVLIQRNISARDGVPIEGVGHPLGTLEDHAEIAAGLMAHEALGPSAAVLVRQASRAGRQALEKIRGNDEAPAGKDVAATEVPNPTGVGGLATKAAETALSTSAREDASRRGKVNSAKDLPAPEILEKVSQQPGNIREEKLSPTEQERAAGKAFAALGYDVLHKKESTVESVKSADLFIGGIGDVEVYSPMKTTRADQILRRIEEKQWQGRSLLVQTELPAEAIQSIAARLWGKQRVINIHTLFFQSPDGATRRFNRPGDPGK